MRRANVVSARCSGSMEVDWADLSSDAVMNDMLAYRQMVNGNLRLRKPQHYEHGCCADADGTISRKTHVDIFLRQWWELGYSGVSTTSLLPRVGGSLVRFVSLSTWRACSRTSFCPRRGNTRFPDGILSRTPRSKTWTTSRRLRVPRRIVENFG